MRDFGVGEWHGRNALIRDGDRILRTYFVSGCGDEVTANTWSYLDLTALGRQEEWEDSPEGYPETPPYVWWKWHAGEQTLMPSAGWPSRVARSIRNREAPLAEPR